MKSSIRESLEKVRLQKPVVHHITNWVTTYDCANIVKVFGASPVMAHAKEEVADMAGIASALVLNIGTLTEDLVEAMLLAGKSANNKGIPVVLDVCGAGATKFRNDMCSKILKEVKIGIIKGNASEIASIAGENIQTRGVDSVAVEKDLKEVAIRLSEKTGCAVVITGIEDIIADEKRVIVVKNGTSMMANVVGTGCMATSVIGTFAAVNEDLVEAAVAGLVCYEVAAELATKTAKGPATFKEMLFDAIFNLDAKTVDQMQRVEE